MALKEADAANRSNTAVADIMDNNTGALGMENETIGGESSKVPALVKKDKYKSAALPILVIRIFLQT